MRIGGNEIDFDKGDKHHKTFYLTKQYDNWYLTKLYKYIYEDGIWRTTHDADIVFHNREEIIALIKILLASENIGYGENWFRDFLKKLITGEEGV